MRLSTAFVSIQTQAVKLHKNFDHFKYSLRVNRKTLWVNILRSLSKVRETRLEIISREPSDTMTGQIHFNSVTYRFWPVKFMRQITLKTRAKKQLWVQIFRGVEGPQNLLEILSNTCRYNIFETYLGCWGC